MKKLLLLTALVMAGALGLSSCKEYLDTAPEDFVAPKDYYNTEAQLTSALMAVYSKLGQSINASGSGEESTYARFLSLEAPSATDEMMARSNSATTVSAYNFDAAYPSLGYCWANLYEGINRANLLLENLDRANVSTDVKNEIRGEALFLRGYYYFVLVGYWGGVPLKLSSTQSVEQVSIARNTEEEVYGQVIKDMTEGRKYLKNGTEWGNSGRISRTAAAGILARVNLYAAGRISERTTTNAPDQYRAVLAWTDTVRQSGQHSLNPDYAQIFKNECADVYDLKESMWEVEFNGNGVGNVYRETERFSSTLGVNNNNSDYGYMQGLYLSTGVQYDRYGTGDQRRDWNIANYYYPGFDAARGPTAYSANYKWGRYINKWRREAETLRPYSKNFAAANWPLLRYADVLLMYAEADNELNGPTASAVELVNQVRRRAYGKPLTTPDALADMPAAGQTDQVAFRAYLRDERSRELAFEGWRKLDLLRWGKDYFVAKMQGMITSLAAAPSNSNTALGYYGRTQALRPYQNALAQPNPVQWPIPSLEMALNQAMKQNNGW